MTGGRDLSVAPTRRRLRLRWEARVVSGLNCASVVLGYRDTGWQRRLFGTKLQWSRTPARPTRNASRTPRLSNSVAWPGGPGQQWVGMGSIPGSSKSGAHRIGGCRHKKSKRTRFSNFTSKNIQRFSVTMKNANLNIPHWACPFHNSKVHSMRACELIGFSPRIDRIFPSSTSKDFRRVRA